MLRQLRGRPKERSYVRLRDLHARIESGEVTESSELSSILDSLDLVELTMVIKELEVEPTVPIKTIGDLLWLLKAIDFQHQRKKKTGR